MSKLVLLTDLRDELQATEKDIEALGTQIDDIESEISSLTEKRISLERRQNVLFERKNSLEMQMDEMKSDLKAMETVIPKLTKEKLEALLYNFIELQGEQVSEQGNLLESDSKFWIGDFDNIKSFVDKIKSNKIRLVSVTNGSRTYDLTCLENDTIIRYMLKVYLFAIHHFGNFNNSYEFFKCLTTYAYKTKNINRYWCLWDAKNGVAISESGFRVSDKDSLTAYKCSEDLEIRTTQRQCVTVDNVIKQDFKRLVTEWVGSACFADVHFIYEEV